MQNGKDNLFDRANRAIKQMAACGLSYSAKDIKRLVEYTHLLEKNEKNLIEALVHLKKINKRLNKIAERMYIMMSEGQKNIIDVWLEEGDNNDSK